jgi:3-oxoacyl-[acyl-carrier-protein] synthase II
MQAALKEAGLPPSAIGYVNAHATSTPLGDAIEARAIRDVFGEQVPVSSCKVGRDACARKGWAGLHWRLFFPYSLNHDLTSCPPSQGALGHLLGAAGAIEAAITIMSLKNGMLPHTLNLTKPSAGIDIDLIMGAPRQSNG